MVENYLLAQFNKSNGNELKEVPFPKPLHVEYGSYGVQKGNTKLAQDLSTFICSAQKSGQLAKVYQVTIGAPLPQMPRLQVTRPRRVRGRRLSPPATHASHASSLGSMSTSPYDVLVVGGGPAGLAATVEAAGPGSPSPSSTSGPRFGGQIFKQPGPGFRVTSPEALGKDFVRGRALIDEAERSGADLLPRTSAVAIEGTEVMLLEDGGQAAARRARGRIVSRPERTTGPSSFRAGRSPA